MVYFIPFDTWELCFLSSCSNHQRVCGFSQSMVNISKLLSDIMPAKNTELSWHQNSGVGLSVNPLCGQVSIKFQVPTRWLLKYKVFKDYMWAKLWSINAFSVSRQGHITLFSFSNDTAAFSLPLLSRSDDRHCFGGDRWYRWNYSSHLLLNQSNNKGKSSAVHFALSISVKKFGWHILLSTVEHKERQNFVELHPF